MPIYEYQCQECGWVEDLLLKISEALKAPNISCPMRCADPDWRKKPSAPAEHLRVRSEGRFPHVTHMREPCVRMTKDGPVRGTKRVVAQSRSHMEKLMEKHGYVYYEEPTDGGSQSKQGQMPDHIKRLEKENPMVRKYLDMKADGRIPKAMVLSEEQLKERFHVAD